MQDRLNPYSVGGSLIDPRGTGFFGRDDVFDFVRQSLQTARRPPVVLYGQRRIGKSSVLRQLPRHLPEGTTCVYFDLQGQAQLPLDVMLYGLSLAIAKACKLPKPSREAITAASFLEFLDRACAQLGSPRQLVLLFDEFDVVDVGAATNTAASGFLGYLAKLIEHAPELGVVLVVGRKIAELSEEFVGAILRNAVQHRLVRLTRRQSDQLAEGLGAGMLEFSAAALDVLYRLAGGHPYCTQLLCNMVWQRLVTPAAGLPVRATSADLEAALAPAVEYGTSGLSWIYDGLTVPSHRLFLAAMAELQEDHPDRSVRMSEIEQRLVKRGVQLDAAELHTAPARLANWDVVDGTQGAGYRFAVPMIGLWIRLNRPLLELQEHTQLVNPRAWRFYELAALSQQREQWDEAIPMYRQALAANPALVEAQLALGASLRARGGSGDVALAIEAYERALDLDPAAPRAALLELLGEQIERNGHDPAVQVAAYKRVAALEPQGAAAARAQRRLAQFARLWLSAPKQARHADALFAAIDDAAGRAEAAAVLAAAAPSARVENWGGRGFVLALLLLVVLAVMPLESWFGLSALQTHWLRGAVAAVAVTSLALGIAASSLASLPRLVFIGYLVCGVCGGLLAWLDSVAAAFGLGFLFAATAASLLAPGAKLPAELQPPLPPKPDKPARPLSAAALRLSAWLQRYAGGPGAVAREGAEAAASGTTSRNDGPTAKPETAQQPTRAGTP